jgi:hypothetical protein
MRGLGSQRSCPLRCSTACILSRQDTASCSEVNIRVGTLGAFSVMNRLIRGVVFAAPIACHMLWRHGDYGSWLPSTLSAKTGNLAEQLAGGQHYLGEYLQHASWNRPTSAL